MSSRSRAVALTLALVLCGLRPLPLWAGNNCGGGGKPRPDEGGIGGTGKRPDAPGEDDSGVGGTGKRPVGPDEDDSGVGGTGIAAADTGIIGTITGFASICVGGVEIYYGADSGVQIDGESATVKELQVGQVVEVVASGSGTEVNAQEISVRHVVAGPVTGVDPERNELEVVGQTVVLSGARAADSDAAQSAVATSYQPGTFVRISGLRRSDGTIAASLVSQGGEVARLAGPVARVDGGRVEIEGTSVRLADGMAAAPGDQIRVSGRWEGDQLVATSLETIPRVPFDGRVDRVEIEGYAAGAATGELRVGPFVFDVPQSATAEDVPQVKPDELVRVRAVMHDRRAVVERIGILAEPPARPEGKGARSSGAGGMRGHPGGEQLEMERRRGDGPARDGDASEAPKAGEGREGGIQPRSDRIDRPGTGDEPGSDRPPPMQRPDQPAPVQKPDRPAGVPDRPGAPAPFDRPNVPVMPDRPPGLPDRAPLPDKPAVPPRIERPPVPDRAPLPDRPQRPDRPDVPKRP